MIAGLGAVSGWTGVPGWRLDEVHVEWDAEFCEGAGVLEKTGEGGQ